MGNRQPTVFEQRIYEAVSTIPNGRVTTYKSLAKRVGCGSSQAVGQTLKRNPFAPEIPCHRVISSQLKLAGYTGKVVGEDVKLKREFLAAEGVEFDSSGDLLDSERLIEL
ncbi:MAG: methylated-DNA-[protein]-cysteine S-methyltransferase [Crocinitomicaceae bacterium]|jgi:methylated-DNA-[protein]-cysteine S-methyltransferase